MMDSIFLAYRIRKSEVFVWDRILYPKRKPRISLSGIQESILLLQVNLPTGIWSTVSISILISPVPVPLWDTNVKPTVNSPAVEQEQILLDIRKHLLIQLSLEPVLITYY